jgi:hypothetical protein
VSKVRTYGDSSVGEADGVGHVIGGDAGGARPSRIERLLDKQEVARFESRSPYQFIWAEELKCQTGVYVRRWYLQTPWFSVRVHHWIHSDDKRFFHDHAWWFLTLVLRGGYTDITPNGRERMRVGSVRFRPANHQHWVEVDRGGCWTVLLTGPKARRWGFWVKGKMKKSNKFFFEHGIHICD